MKRSPVKNSSSHHLGRFPSPEAPKGWSSERVAHPTSSSSSRRHISAAALSPFCSGRALPSKWEDAERWICSPVSGYSTNASFGIKNSLPSQFQRRPKSKSGPIAAPGPGMHYYSSYSPAMQALDAATANHFVAASPFSTGVLVADGICVNYSGGVNYCGQGYLMQNRSHAQADAARSKSVPGWSDLASDDSLPSSPDEKFDQEAVVSHVPSRRDMATQMSPSSSTISSPRGESPFSPSGNAVKELQNDHPARLEVREVQVDKRSTTISWSERHGSRRIKTGSPTVRDLCKNVTGFRTPSFDLSESATNISKIQREEAKITAWENLQKSKAEAAVRKLEMKLEKERSHSTEKILNKLKLAQMRAQEMKSSISAKQGQQLPKNSHKTTFFRNHPRTGSFRSCFTCRHT